MILVTGGCGYIGSHIILNLIKNKYDVISLDNLSNSSIKNVDKINLISGKKLNFIKGDLRNKLILEEIFSNNNIDTVIHLAGLKSLEESFREPLNYFTNNIIGSINLINSMLERDTKNIIFSSTATVYNHNHNPPWTEELEIQMPENPYAQTKYIVEEILKTTSATAKLNVGILRYFNPIGGHESGIIGENVSSKTTNLVPSIIKVLKGEKKHLEVYGDDYDTPDGSAIRDYIHISDLVEGHIKALKYITEKGGYNVWNLGTGRGYSVFEILKYFEELSKTKIPIKKNARRKGDLKEFWADTRKANKELNFNAKHNIKQMISDSLLFINKNNK